MIIFRHADGRYPFFWESNDQPPARWHGEGDGPVQYLADTPNGAWAEFLRHEEIVDPVDLAGIRRAMWAVGVVDVPEEPPALPLPTLLGDETSYQACQNEAQRLRALGALGLRAPSAALLPGEAAGWNTQEGLRRTPAQDGTTVVLFGPRPDVEGWVVSRDARPPLEALDQVRHF